MEGRAVAGEERYGIDELADLGGVSRRTVRYYVQEGLLPPPLGVGRGRHYGPEHLRRLVQVKTLQEAGRSLDEVRRVIATVAAGRTAVVPLTRDGLRRLLAGDAAAAPAAHAQPSRSAWTRVSLLPGVELHVSSRHRLPTPGRLEELADWCRRHFRPEGEPEEP